MTKQELMGLPHLAISEEKSGMFVHVHTEEGYKITNYTDDKDIKDYSAFICMYCPIQDNYEDYRIITLEEDANYLKLQEEARKQEEAARVASI